MSDPGWDLPRLAGFGSGERWWFTGELPAWAAGDVRRPTFCYWWDAKKES